MSNTTEHELTEEKIVELHNEASSNLYLLGPWSLMGGAHKVRQVNFARAAYDLGKAAQNDDGESSDGFLPCEFEDIRKGDTVERTLRYSHGAVVTTVGVADHPDSYDNWRDYMGLLLVNDNANYTYRRKPAPVVHPDPEEHPIILDGNGLPHVWDGNYYCPLSDLETWWGPEHFGNDWVSAKVVAKEED